MPVKSEKMALHVPFWTIFPTGTPIAFFSVKPKPGRVEESEK